MAEEFDPIDYNAGREIEIENFGDEMLPGGVLDAADETPLVDNLPEAHDTFESPAKQEKIESMYKYFEDKGFKVDKSAHLKYGAVFELNEKKELTIKYAGKTVKLSQTRDPNIFYSPKTLMSDYVKGGKVFVENVLGIAKKPKIRQPVEARAIILDQNLPREENIPTQDLAGVAEQVRESAEDLETSLHDALLDTDFNTDNLLLEQSIRDLKSARKVFNSFNDQITITTNKISVYDRQIEQLKAQREIVILNREEGVDVEERLREINDQIKELRKQREIQDKRLKRDLLPKIKSEFARIRETVDTILYSNKTLGEKIKTLFRTRGITIASVLTAFGLAIYAIVEKIINTVAKPKPKPKPEPKPKPTPEPTPEPTPGPTPEPTPEPEPTPKNWIKKTLEKIKKYFNQVRR